MPASGFGNQMNENMDYSEIKDRIKVVFFDIDGTLLPLHGNQIPQSTKESISSLRDKGIKVIIATGRNKDEMVELKSVMEIPFDGYLLLNGQICLDETMRVYAGNPINREELEVLAGIFQTKKIPFMFSGADGMYINYLDDTVRDVQATTNGVIPNIGEYHGEDIYQICSFVGDDMKELLDSFLDECEITSWNPRAIDIIPKGGGKHIGIQLYLDAYGLKPENVMAFGDGENDTEMLKIAGVGVAMGNAIDSLKAVADYVTDSVEDDGIMHALQHFGIIE